MLSDIEVEHQDVEGELVSIRYGDGDDAVVVATTRVETMLGDTGDRRAPRRRALHAPGRPRDRAAAGRAHDQGGGRRARRPELRHRRGQDHPGARPERLRDRPPARPADADDHGRVRADRRHRHRVRRHGPLRGAGQGARGARGAGPDRRREAALPAQRRALAARSKEPIEPRLSLQWFVKVGPLAQAAGDAVRDGRVAVHPKELEPRWFGWVDNMHDWCISRQLWWGHRIPVWYGARRRGRLPRPRRAAARGLDPGRGRARHLVLLGAVAVLHAGLAGADAGPGALLPDTRCWSPATTSCSSGSPG